MNGRIQKIISLLLKEPNITISEMMQKLSLSRRQINYAVKLINNTLRAKHFPEITRHKNGTFEYDTSIRLLIQAGKEDQFGELSDRDRKVLIITYLILKTSYVSLNHLTSFLKYSKTTVISDIKEAQKFVKRNNLEIIYNRVEGYSLKGEKDDIYKLATKLFLNNPNLITSDLIISITKNRTIAKKATVLILDIEEKFKATFSDIYFKALNNLFQTILYRSQNSNCKSNCPSDPFITETNEYKFLKTYSGLENLDNVDLKWLVLEILASNVYDKTNLQYGSDEVKILHFIHQIVEGFKQKTLVQIDDQKQFEKRLMNHLRPACYRVKYELPNIEKLELNNSENHQILFQIIKNLIRPLEDWIGKTFPKGEVQLLTYYFGYLLASTPENRDINKPIYKAIVVCSNGIIMSNILIKILKEILPELNFICTMSIREFNNSKERFDIVFTTLPLNTNKIQFVVKPNMNYSEKIGLRYRVLNQLKIEKTDKEINKLLELISRYANLTDNQILKADINRMLLKQNFDNSDNKKSHNLLSYLHPNYIVLNKDTNIEWKVALHKAIKPLLKDKKIEKRYEFELQRQINNPDNYSFLGTSISIPHSLPKTGILDSGIGFLVSKTPIEMPYNKTVNIIAPVAFSHTDNKLKAINQFTSLAMNKNIINKILSCKTSFEVYQIILKFVEEEEKNGDK